MLGPIPPPPAADRPELPRVRLEVRASVAPGSASRTPPRAVTYEVGSGEFVIGGAGGCDLRLPAPNLPPVIAQITRKPDGVRVRRLTPVLPITLNGEPLPANVLAPLAACWTATVISTPARASVSPAASGASTFAGSGSP